jgi:hypothetical protein
LNDKNLTTARRSDFVRYLLRMKAVGISEPGGCQSWGPWGAVTGKEVEPLTRENIWFLNALDDAPRPKLKRHRRSKECQFNHHEDCSTSPCTCSCHQLQPGRDYAKARRAKLQCKHCGHMWLPRIIPLPAKCPRCQSAYWNREDYVKAQRAKAAVARKRYAVHCRDREATAMKLIREVEANGGVLRMDGPKVVVTPSAAAIPLQEQLIAYKKEIVVLLRKRNGSLPFQPGAVADAAAEARTMAEEQLAPEWATIKARLGEKLWKRFLSRSAITSRSDGQRPVSVG